MSILLSSVLTHHWFAADRRVNFAYDPDKESSINALHESIPDVFRAFFSDWRVDQLA